MSHRAKRSTSDELLLTQISRNGDRGSSGNISRQHNFGIFLTHPPVCTQYFSINTVLNVSKFGHFLDRRTQSLSTLKSLIQEQTGISKQPASEAGWHFFQKFVKKQAGINKQGELFFET